jgi:hypothetical protein
MPSASNPKIWYASRVLKRPWAKEERKVNANKNKSIELKV